MKKGIFLLCDCLGVFEGASNVKLVVDVAGEPPVGHVICHAAASFAVFPLTDESESLSVGFDA